MTIGPETQESSEVSAAVLAQRLAEEGREAAKAENWDYAAEKLRAAIPVASESVAAELRVDLVVCLSNGALKKRQSAVAMLNTVAREKDAQTEKVLKEFLLCGWAHGVKLISGSIHPWNLSAQERTKVAADMTSRMKRMSVDERQRLSMDMQMRMPAYCYLCGHRLAQGWNEMRVPGYDEPFQICESHASQISAEIERIPGPKGQSEAIALLREAHEYLLDAQQIDRNNETILQGLDEVEKTLSQLGIRTSRRRAARRRAAVPGAVPASRLLRWVKATLSGLANLARRGP